MYTKSNKTAVNGFKKAFKGLSKPSDSAILVLSEEEAYNIYKLAQLPTALQSKDIQLLNKRAKSKWFSEQIGQKLAEMESPLKDYYRNALTCNNALKREGRKITGKYCNTRHCNICNRIRTAKAINHYKEQFDGITNLEFTTLTIPNCTADELKSTIEQILKTTSNICRVFREKRGIDFNGVRKIEITYNSRTNTFHPHVHILHSGNCGKMLVVEWMKRMTTANIKGQDTRKADEDSVKELFKYTTKVIVKDSIDKGTISVFLPAIDTILTAMKNKRSFQTFGKIKKITEDVQDLESEEFQSLDQEYETIYVWENENWFDLYNKEALTQFIPPNIKFKYYE